jgi:hypothetical protein
MDIAISDGSHKNKWGTASWRIMPETNKAEQWAVLQVTPGRKDDQTDFRSEIGGSTLWWLQLNSYASSSTYPMDQVSFGSDCEADLYYIFDRNKKETATTNYFDLIMTTRKVLDQLPISFSHHHVPALQNGYIGESKGRLRYRC